jgi:hypothetical protein
MGLPFRWIVPIVSAGQIDQPCFIRPQRLFSVEHHIILHSVGKVTEAKLDEVLKRTREFFIE